MEKKREICEYRERLDKTLSSPDLTNHQTLKTLIRQQLNQECAVDVLDQRVSDLSSIFEKLRSASTKDQDLSQLTNEASHGDWKVKHDREDCRVMYREGLEGSPFHTLLVEGYMDGPIQDCLCVSWESSLYEKWWPNSAFPAFKILQTKCLQKSRFNEQICLVRMKVPWPMANREAIVQFFLFEYFKDGLVIILLNSISTPEVENFEKNGVYEAADAVKVDLVGGVAIQKVSPERSYLRYISEIDIKLDLVPPSLINLVSRQLLGNGFKLFKKTIGSVAKSDDYSRVLADPLYTMIRQALYSTDKFHGQERRHCEEKEGHYRTEPSHCKRDVTEIEEEECDDDENKSVSSSSSSSSEEEDESYIGKTCNGKTLFCISPEVKQALGTLEKVITMVRKSRTDNNSNNNKTLSTSLEEEEEEASSSSQKLHLERAEIVSSSKVCTQDPNTEVLDEASLAHYHHHNNNNNRRSGSSSFGREGSKIAPTTTPEVTRITISQATTLFNQTEGNSDDKPSGLNGGKSSVLQRKRQPRCFGIRSWMRKT
ncbi:Polyketide cyclase/dehydrase and lipid transport superfamily protein [Raphanus sativus]|nr:Polyketide cyclase/dehydrase and lipid transport superfamily protein [Raphanus sativus]